MRKVLLSLAIMAVVALGLTATRKGRSPLSDSQIRDNVVALMTNGQRFCTAEQIVAPSGDKYLLSASHCALNSIGQEFEAETEDGARYPVKVLAEDDASDLILLSPIKHASGLHIALGLKERQRVKAFTRAHGFRTFRTEGVAIQVEHIDVPVSAIQSLEDATKCAGLKYKMLDSIFFQACALSVDSMVSTIFVAPGSSGGALLNDSGDVVGVATAIGEGFSFWVPLSDIRRFLSDK